MQKFLLITTLDNSKKWPFAQYHETAALQSLYRHAIKVNIKKVFKLETPMIVRHCVSMFNESTEGIPLFLDTISSQFLFPVDPFPADFLHTTPARLSTPNKPNKAECTHLRSHHISKRENI